MSKRNIGIVHPGLMGVSIAASAQNTGHKIHWASEGRSSKTQERAEKHNFTDTHSLRRLCETCSFIICVCPPHSAEDVARKLLDQGLTGMYLDANAISPQRADRIGQAMQAAGVSFIDGGIIGPPAWKPGKTWLYLSGSDAPLAASCFSAGPLETVVVDKQIGSASAIKMCYAAYSKGTTALLGAILAAAESYGIRAELQQQWTRSGLDLNNRGVEKIKASGAKAWRYVGEMEEIAASFHNVGITGDFHKAAADIFRKIAPLKDSPNAPSPLEEILALIRPRKEP